MSDSIQQSPDAASLFHQRPQMPPDAAGLSAGRPSFFSSSDYQQAQLNSMHDSYSQEKAKAALRELAQYLPMSFSSYQEDRNSILLMIQNEMMPLTQKINQQEALLEDLVEKYKETSKKYDELLYQLETEQIIKTAAQAEQRETQPQLEYEHGPDGF